MATMERLTTRTIRMPDLSTWQMPSTTFLDLHVTFGSDVYRPTRQQELVRQHAFDSLGITCSAPTVPTRIFVKCPCGRSFEPEPLDDYDALIRYTKVDSGSPRIDRFDVTCAGPLVPPCDHWVVEDA